jgi:hypothetical protein
MLRCRRVITWGATTPGAGYIPISPAGRKNVRVRAEAEDLDVSGGKPIDQEACQQRPGDPDPRGRITAQFRSSAMDEVPVSRTTGLSGFRPCQVRGYGRVGS